MVKLPHGKNTICLCTTVLHLKIEGTMINKKINPKIPVMRMDLKLLEREEIKKAVIFWMVHTRTEFQKMPPRSFWNTVIHHTYYQKILLEFYFKKNLWFSKNLRFIYTVSVSFKFWVFLKLRNFFYKKYHQNFLTFEKWLKTFFWTSVPVCIWWFNCLGHSFTYMP